MRALVKEAQKQFVILNLPKPESDGYHVIIRVSRVGICGSDVHMWSTDDRIGLVMGHEFCGVVEDTGARDDLRVGDRVLIHPNGAGTFRQGAYADWFASPPESVLKLPDSVDDDTAAMVEPACITLKAQYVTNVKINEKVLITGTGIIGLLTAEWLRIAGADYIAMTEVNSKRIEQAKKLNVADDIFDARDPDLAEKLTEQTGGGFDKIVECTGQGSALEFSLKTIRKAGTIVYVGIDYHPFPFLSRPLVANDVILQGCYGSGIPYFRECLHHLNKGKLEMKQYITSHIALEEVQAKFEELSSSGTGEIKSIVILDR